MRALIPLRSLQWPLLDILQQIQEITDMRLRPFATQQGIANVGELVVDGTVVAFYLYDCPYNKLLVIIVPADGVEKLSIVRMAIRFILDLPPTAGSIFGYTSALVVSVRKKVGNFCQDLI